MKLFILLIVLFVQGCTTYVGLGIHSEKYGAPEITLENPIGIIGLSKSYGDFDLFIEHHSGLFVREDGTGYNITGVKYYFSKE